MSDLEQSALAVYFANCQGIKSDPLPMLRKILALGEGEGGEVVWVTVNGEDSRAVLTDLPAGTPVRIVPQRPESV